MKASDDVPPLPAYPPTPAHNTTPCRPLVSMHLTQQLSKRRNKLCSLRGAADPTSDASSVEASGFELKLSNAQHSRKISEKLFEASWLDISAPKQGKKGERKEREGRNGKEGKGREGKETGRKVKRREKKGTTAIWLDIVCKIGLRGCPALESGIFGVTFSENV